MPVVSSVPANLDCEMPIAVLDLSLVVLAMQPQVEQRLSRSELGRALTDVEMKGQQTLTAHPEYEQPESKKRIYLSITVTVTHRMRNVLITRRTFEEPAPTPAAEAV